MLDLCCIVIFTEENLPIPRFVQNLNEFKCLKTYIIAKSHHELNLSEGVKY